VTALGRLSVGPGPDGHGFAVGAAPALVSAVPAIRMSDQPR
jgi:hypothetical protein